MNINVNISDNQYSEIVKKISEDIREEVVKKRLENI